jgi:hypothetical protein
VSSSLLFLACIGIIIPSTAKIIYGGEVITRELLQGKGTKRAWCPSQIGSASWPAPSCWPGCTAASHTRAVLIMAHRSCWLPWWCCSHLLQSWFTAPAGSPGGAVLICCRRRAVQSESRHCHHPHRHVSACCARLDTLPACLPCLHMPCSAKRPLPPALIACLPACLLPCPHPSPLFLPCSYVGYLFFQLKTHADCFQVSMPASLAARQLGCAKPAGEQPQDSIACLCLICCTPGSLTLQPRLCLLRFFVSSCLAHRARTAATCPP